MLSDNRWNNLEAVMSVAEAMSQVGQERVVLDGEDLTADELNSRLRLWTWKVYHQLPVARSNPPEYVNAQSYDRLFDFIRNQQLADHISVVTTNYDISYEYLSWKRKLPCRYPFDWRPSRFSAGHGKKQWVYGISRKASGTVVCKLHGSINYFVRPGFDDSHCEVASDLGDKRAIGKSGIWNGQAAILAVDAIWNIRERFGHDWTPAIIPPTYAKIHGKPWLAATLAHAFDAIRRARLIIFIGYSFPPSDGFTEAFLAGAIGMGESAHRPAVYVVDPLQGTHDRFRSIFGEMLRGFDPMLLSEATRGHIQKAIRQHV
jgi:hypothetical protein